MRYIGRFAPSPTGALHAGSLVAALASWLDAKAHGGTWLVRIEDVDTPRCIPGAADEIFRQLAACGLNADQTPVYQSQRSAQYQAALDQLIGRQAAYPCACSRKDIEAVLAAQAVVKVRHGELIYPGTCRNGLTGSAAQPKRSMQTTHAWRFHTEFFTKNKHLTGNEYTHRATDLGVNQPHLLIWHDRRLGVQQQDLTREVGDFVLKRADGLWTYQLAVVADDAAQGITHIVRGEDLANNTARQIALQQALNVPRPEYLHTPLVLAPDGHKLSKQNGAQALQLTTESQVQVALCAAATVLGLDCPAHRTKSDILLNFITQWRTLHGNNWFQVRSA